MKKLISILLAACISVSLAALPQGGAYAGADATVLKEDTNPLFNHYMDVPFEKPLPPYTLGAANGTEDAPYFTDYKAASCYVRDRMLQRAPTVTLELSKNATDNLENVYRYTKDSFYYIVYGAFSDYISAYSNDGDYLACSFAKAGCQYWTYDDYYTLRFTLQYRTTADEENAVEAYSKRVANEILNKKLSRLEAIKTVHDTICALTQYDYDSQDKEIPITSNVNTAYSAVATGKTMCEGYSMLFYRICKELDIPVRIVESNTHAWNLVKPVEGKYYYNIDVTWDDNYDFPDEQAPNGCDYFLKCDSEVQKNISHRGYLSNQNTDHNRMDYYNSDYFNAHFPVAQASYYLNNEGAAQCAYCGAAVDYAVPTADTHRYAVTVTEPTCTENGYKLYRCEVCDDSFEERVPALGHKAGPQKAEITLLPSCTADGVKAVNTYCVRCSVLLHSDEVKLNRIGHSFTDSSKYCMNGCNAVNPAYVFPSTNLKKLTAKKKAVKVTWKKTAGISGYQLQYSLKSNFKGKSVKTITVNKASAASKTVKKLKSKKKYYFRIRTYKLLGGKKVYAKWSSKKSVKTK